MKREIKTESNADAGQLDKGGKMVGGLSTGTLSNKALSMVPTVTTAAAHGPWQHRGMNNKHSVITTPTTTVGAKPS